MASAEQERILDILGVFFTILCGMSHFCLAGRILKRRTHTDVHPDECPQQKSLLRTPRLNSVFTEQEAVYSYIYI